MSALHAVGHALAIAGSMTWEVLWALILGFFLSGVIQAVVRKDEISRLLPDDRPRTLAIATGIGAASSSCSYAAVALARALFRKGANFTAALAFEIASTNLVIELGIILALLMGWQFTVAEFVGGPLMIIFVALMFRLWVRGKIVEEARRQSDRAVAGSMEGHAAMDMSVPTTGPIWRRVLSPAGFTSTSQYFAMDWAAVYRDVFGGLLLAGAAAAWVPATFWQGLFLENHHLLATLWGPIIGPVVALLSFVCSIGNVPLAAVLWNGGISFGGVVSFIFADLIIIPIILIYRKYYGTKMALRITGTFYLAMVVAGYLVELVFTPLGLVPAKRNAHVLEAGISWNYTTCLNIAFLALAAALVWRFVRTGGLPMLRMMGGDPDAGHDEDEHAHA
ncbi:MAG: permease [Mycobacteriales bacterium]